MSVSEQAVGWPAVRPEVVAEVVAGLSVRLQKRLDAAAAKLAERPVLRTGDEWRVEVDEEAALVLHAAGAVVADQADVRCGCLLAPSCVHRAAAVMLCPLAEEPVEEPAGESAAPAPAGPERTGAEPVDPEPTGTESADPEPTGTEPTGTALTGTESAAARHLHRAGCAILAAGVSGAGAVAQAELLRAAHRARLAGLYRPAAAAVTVVTRVRAARSGAPEYRLADLVAGLRELLALTTALTCGVGPVAGLRGTARQVYEEEGGLRLHGLFAEPVLTATHAGALSWAVDAAGRLSTIAEVVPHGDAAAAAAQAVGAGNRAVRLGEAQLSHREFSRAGLLVQGATRSAAGRLGAGAAVRAVRASGAAWTAEPVAALWAEPAAVQVARALEAEEEPHDTRRAGSDLLFLDVTLLGAVPDGPGGAPQLLARCTDGAEDGHGADAGPGADGPGLLLALRPGHEHPGLAFRANLALLATAPGLRLRVIGRLERAERPALRLLAIGTPPAPPRAPGDHDPQGAPALALPVDRADRVNLGLERLQTADLAGADRTAAAPTGPAPTGAAPRDLPAAAPYGPPVHVLGRRVDQTVTTGRHATAPSAATAAADRELLRAAGLGTAAELLDVLRSAAADQRRDVFGRVVADDHEAFAGAWLAAACYTEAVATALCAAGWSGEADRVPAAEGRPEGRPEEMPAGS
ncbi:hypothetical protein [Kitasatospora sp. NPDC048538]|uniref:hypothetical protein n=1 Tax=unclassified Kitasatospora TaxID=2633591 RepID=UPI0033E8F410